MCSFISGYINIFTYIGMNSIWRFWRTGLVKKMRADFNVCSARCYISRLNRSLIFSGTLSDLIASGSPVYPS